VKNTHKLGTVLTVVKILIILILYALGKNKLKSTKSNKTVNCGMHVVAFLLNDHKNY